MKIKTSFLALLAFLFTGIYANANNSDNYQSKNQNKVERVVKLSGFQALNVSGGVNVYLISGQKNEAVIRANKDIIDKIVVEQKGNTVNIYTKRNTLLFAGRNSSMDIYLTYTNISSIDASGGSDIETSENTIIVGESFKISGSGGTDIDLHLNVRNLECDFSGGSDVDLRGRATVAKFDASGGCDVDAKELFSEKVTIDASGGADVEVYASKSINADASGAADIEYYGNPIDKKFNKSGGADIYRGDD